jgi:hypothetical protein
MQSANQIISGIFNVVQFPRDYSNLNAINGSELTLFWMITGLDKVHEKKLVLLKKRW